MDGMGHLHVLIAQIPMMLFTLTLMGDMLFAIEVKKAVWVGHVGVILGTIACIPTLLTGMSAMGPLADVTPSVWQHAQLGILTTIFASSFAGVRIAWLWWRWNPPGLLIVILSILLVALTYWTTAITSVPLPSGG